MYKAQARGYYFEEIVRKLLEESNFLDVRTGYLPGRGADHEIDSYGVFAFNIPFVYPIRLISEAKCYVDRNVGLSLIRNFVGVIKDISENYFVERFDGPSKPRLLKDRYTDCGAYFSAAGFSFEAQNYAWAHGIYLVPFENNRIFKPILNEGLELLDQVEVESLTRQAITHLAKEHFQNNSRLAKMIRETHAYFGILDGVYPIYITSSKPFNFSPEIGDEYEGFGEESSAAIKEGRYETTESINFRFDLNNTKFEFTIPRLTSGNLIDAIERTYREGSGDPFSYIEIPVRLTRENMSFRRIFKINLSLFEREKFMEEIRIPGTKKHRRKLDNNY